MSDLKFNKIFFETERLKFKDDFANNIARQNTIIKVNADKSGVSLSLKAEKKVFVEKVVMECKIEKKNYDVFLKEGYQSWSFSAALGKNDRQQKSFAEFVNRNQENNLNKPSGKKNEHVSEQFCFIGNKTSKEGIFIAQQPPFNQYVSFQFKDSKNELTLLIIWDLYKEFKEGEFYECDEVKIYNGDFYSLQRKYFAEINKSMKINFRNDKRTGWCSWYYYFTEITPDKILTNLEAAVNTKLKIDFFQIDDGYQSTVGDWLRLKPEFEGRMKEIGGRVKDAGYTAGLWLAPFIISKKSQHFNKAGWVLKESNGKNVVAGINPAWGGYYYALDITHPEVREYLTNVFKTVKYDWGYDYLKLDFMYAASLPGNRYDKTMTRAEVLKSGMKLIREATGVDTTILGCGMPISSSIGFVDAMRVSCDVAPHWKPVLRDRIFKSDSMIETRGALRNSMVRSAMHNNLWVNDPDCLMIRTEDTHLTENERKSLYNVLLACGGMLVFSDDMGAYSENQLKKLNSILDEFQNMKDGTLYCEDILDNKQPEVFYNDKGFLVLSNFQENDKRKIISGDFFKKHNISKIIDMEDKKGYNVDGEFSIELGVHESRIFKTE